MNVLVNGEIVLHGTVGDVYWESGFTARDVIEALASLGRGSDVTVRINSGGGVAWEGVAIYNALDAHKGKVTCLVEGVAASAASIIAMAGDDTVMLAGSLMMIHDPALITFGDATDHAKSIEILDKLGSQLAGIYAEKTGSDADAVRDLMKAETWMTADEAVSLKFADRSDQAAAAEAMAFDYSKYAQAPEQLTALAEARHWNHQTSKDEPMSKQTTVAPAAAATPAVNANEIRAEERKRGAAIRNSPEAKGREDMAAHLADETDMTAEAAIALLAKAPKAEVKAAEMSAAPAVATLAGLELAAPAAPAAPAVNKIDVSSVYATRRKH